LWDEWAAGLPAQNKNSENPLSSLHDLINQINDPRWRERLTAPAVGDGRV